MRKVIALWIDIGDADSEFSREFKYLEEITDMQIDMTRMKIIRERDEYQ